MNRAGNFNRFDRLRRFSILILAVAGLAMAAGSRSAEDYLHAGASKYIQGRLQEAGVEVEEGLRRYPNDSKLKALAGQLKNMKDQQKKDQGGQNSQGGDQNQDKQDKKDSSGQGNQNGKKDQKDKDKDKGKDKDKDKQNEKDKDKDKGPKDGQDQPQPQPEKQGDSSGQEAAPAKPGQMSKDEAERLLNSYQDDEKREQKQMQKRNRGSVEVEEDW